MNNQNKIKEIGSIKDLIAYSHEIQKIQNAYPAYGDVIVEGSATPGYTPITDTRYSGTAASYFWLPATYGLDSLRKGVVFLKDGIKKQYTVPYLDFKYALQPRTASPISPTASSNKSQYTISGRTLTPQDLMVYNEFDPRDFEDYWNAETLSTMLLTREIPATAQSYMIQQLLNRSGESIESCIWMGSIAYQNNPNVPFTDPRYQLQFFDGFIKRFVSPYVPATNFVAQVGLPTANWVDQNNGVTANTTAPIAVTSIAGSTAGTYTQYGIQQVLDDLISAVSSNLKALLANPSRYTRMKFLVSINTEQIYNSWVTNTLNFKGNNTFEEATNKYKGYEIVPLAGMPDNTVIFCEAIDDVTSTLWVGMNSIDDNQVELAKLLPNSEIYFIKGLNKYDVQYADPKQVFMYTTIRASNFTGTNSLTEYFSAVDETVRQIESAKVTKK